MTDVVRVVGRQGAVASTNSFVEQLTGERQPDGASIWSISTKYYETSVSIEQGTFHDASSAGSFEALVLIVPLNQGEALQEAKTWFETECKQIHGCCPIALLVLDSENGTLASWGEGDVSWCIEHGFEWVHVSLGDADVDQRLAHDDGHGMARVKEALKSHMWPSCTNARNTEAIPKPAFLDASQIGDDDVDGFEKLLLEMTNARDRLRLLPDQERRQGAADLAMKLAQFFRDD